MSAFFVQDFRSRYRYFSSEPIHQIEVELSRPKKLWQEAKKRLMLLPKRILAQEQAFEQTLKCREKVIEIYYSGLLDQDRIRKKFLFFLQKQRSKHVLFLAVEFVLLPVSGLMALLPGPNVFFGVLALIMITQWQALRGINSLLKKNFEFQPKEDLKAWEQAVQDRKEGQFAEILEIIQKTYRIENLKKILWR
jgi:hypothetical protein